ncbi:hypothetical protein [Synechocystis sp. LKSZ1]|uniref:hypothetical protein n=1 Tax=Synechocystis sp. LKSZ1 TaxID=3144951 RepID=UPI00336BF8AC
MLNPTTRLLLKVFLLSWGVSWAIKALGPGLNFVPSDTNAWLGASLTSLVIALLLAWQSGPGR